jgi:integrase/recombinase XerD
MKLQKEDLSTKGRRKRTQADRDAALRANARMTLARSRFDHDHPAYAFGLEWLDSQGNPRTAVNYAIQLASWFAYCVERTLDPFAASIMDAKIYLARQAADFAPTTLYLRRAAVRSFYQDAIDMDKTVKDPFRKIRAGNPDPVIPTPALSIEEFDRVVAGLKSRFADGADIVGARDGAMFFVMSRIGPRRIEVHRLTWEDITEVAGMPKIHFHGKGNKHAYTSIPDDVGDMLEVWKVRLAIAAGRAIRPDDAVFPVLGAGGCLLPNDSKCALEPLGSETISTTFKAIMADAGITGKRYAAHVARATAATLARRGGCEIDEIKVMLRHAKRETTERYIRLIENEVSPASSWEAAARPNVAIAPAVEKEVQAPAA